VAKAGASLQAASLSSADDTSPVRTSDTVMNVSADVANSLQEAVDNVRNTAEKTSSLIDVNVSSFTD